MKITLAVGTRPEFIKAAAISRELRENFELVLIHTGQHYDHELSDIFFGELDIPEPDYHLGVSAGTQTHQIGEILGRIEEALVKEKPDLSLVYGDTNTTLAAALASSKLRIKLGHIEAGVRFLDRSMPEEINRVLVDHCSDLLFCPTETAVKNLRREGIINGVHLIGDVNVDVLLYNKEIAEKANILEKLDLKSKEYLIVTIHRQSNTDNKQNLKSIIDALCSVNETIVFPVHPRTRKFLKAYGFHSILENSEHIKLINPLGYLDFLKLMNHSKKIVTDSGGIEQEAYVLRIPCITLMESTGWVETVEDGWNVLVGADKNKILEAIRGFNPKEKQNFVFGDGMAVNTMSEIIKALEDNNPSLS